MHIDVCRLIIVLKLFYRLGTYSLFMVILMDTVFHSIFKLKKDNKQEAYELYLLF